MYLENLCLDPKLKTRQVHLSFYNHLFFLFLICVYSNALQTNFITEANTMNPDQTAPLGAV